jgi:hypothetical protein
MLPRAKGTWAILFNHFMVYLLLAIREALPITNHPFDALNACLY